MKIKLSIMRPDDLALREAGDAIMVKVTLPDGSWFMISADEDSIMSVRSGEDQIYLLPTEHSDTIFVD